MAYPQCLWHCVRRNNCLMLMRNTQQHYCLLANGSCKEAEPDHSIIVTYSSPPSNSSITWWNLRNLYNKSSDWVLPRNDSINWSNATNNDNRNNDCLEWRIHADDWPEDLVVVNDGDNDYAVARFTIGDALLPGAYRNGNTKTVMGGTRQNDLTGEYLLVPPPCSVGWVAWSSSSGTYLPVGAIVGGQLANVMPLYVSMGLVETNKMEIGYYNPETTRGHCWASARIELIEIFLLVRTWT